MVQLVGSNAHPEVSFESDCRHTYGLKAIAYALSETASALQNVEQGSLLLYIKCPVGIYKGSDKVLLMFTESRVLTTRDRRT